MTDLRDGTRDGTSDDQHVPVGSVRSAALSGEAASTEATATETAVLDLDDPRATDREVVGGKGAALAIAANAGCPVIPGWVVTVHGTRLIDGEGIDVLEAELQEAWRGGPVVVRSSSVVEDGDEESMAGRYETVAGVTTVEQLRDAIATVLDSRTNVADDTPDLEPQHDIAVVVQRQVDPTWSGVAFGVDPVTGRPDRRTVAVVCGDPDDLVSGTVDGDTWITDADGAVVTEPEDPEADPGEDLIAAVVDLVNEVGKRFDGPQDVEWAADADGTLYLLQTRPVTTEVTAVPEGPELGTGPIAETFPSGMAALEVDLWVPPLREGIAHALRIGAVASDDDVDASPVLVTIDGRPAVDLELFGRSDRNRSPIRDRARRVVASWRLGRLRAALPAAGRRIARRADEELGQLGPLEDYTDEQLLDLLHRSRDVLRTLHGHEVLTGLLTDPSGNELTGNGVALRLLADARRRGLTDAEAIVREPAILSLYAPRIGGEPDLPTVTDVPDRPDRTTDPEAPGVVREALRMRVRWVHELQARAALVLGRRLHEQDLLDEPATIRHVRLDDLCDSIRTGTAPNLQPPPAEDALPSRFRRAADGTIVPLRSGDGDDGTGAGGGTGRGRPFVMDDETEVDDIPDGVVLLTAELGPELAGVLGRLEGLVAETGSPLSHVAILAREAYVATVVGLAGAREDLADAASLVVDGGAGTVERSTA